ILGRSGAYVAFNAAIAARRGIVPPVGALQAAGATLVTGSDNMAQDMVEVMRAALFLGRISQHDAMWPQPEDVLEWTTRTAAQAQAIARRAWRRLVDRYPEVPFPVALPPA